MQPTSAVAGGLAILCLSSLLPVSGFAYTGQEFAANAKLLSTKPAQLP
jgi:hypothetical protein